MSMCHRFDTLHKTSFNIWLQTVTLRVPVQIFKESVTKQHLGNMLSAGWLIKAQTAVGKFFPLTNKQRQSLKEKQFYILLISHHIPV